MPAFFLPFDQAALYNIIAELLAGEAVGWLKEHRFSSNYIRRVAKTAATSINEQGVNVRAKELEKVLRGDEFWNTLNVEDTPALGPLLIPLLDKQDPLTQDDAAALLASELVLAAVQCLPYEQRTQLSHLNQIQSRLNGITSGIEAMHVDIVNGFAAVTELIRNQETEVTHSVEPVSKLPSSIRTIPAVEVSIGQLSCLQYPWGEWSDRRTELESLIAERHHRAGTAIPKPNVARTLFALEALDFFARDDISLARTRAIDWMRSNIANGWFWEWSEGQTSHSETHIPDVVRRADVRHTAQVLTVLSRWQDSRDSLAGLIRSVSTSMLPDSGLWPNNPRGSTPRLLASVYAVESLEAVTSHVFRLPLSDIVDQTEGNNARRALRRGIGALLADCEQGHGLIGGISSSPNSYLTGLALFRLGYLSRRHSDLTEFVELMVDGLLKSAQEYGWEDASVPPSIRPATRIRTTLRCAAGLARASNAGVAVPSALLEHAVQLTEVILTSERPEMLDSPDYACGVICIFCSREGLVSTQVQQDIGEDVTERAERISLWRKEINSLIKRLKPLADLGIPGYVQVLQEYRERLLSLR